MFSLTGCLTKTREPSLPYYLLIPGGRINGFLPFPWVSVQGFELVSKCPFLTTITNTPTKSTSTNNYNFVVPSWVSLLLAGETEHANKFETQDMHTLLAVERKRSVWLRRLVVTKGEFLFGNRKTLFFFRYALMSFLVWGLLGNCYFCILFFKFLMFLLSFKKFFLISSVLIHKCEKTCLWILLCQQIIDENRRKRKDKQIPGSSQRAGKAMEHEGNCDMKYGYCAWNGP